MGYLSRSIADVKAHYTIVIVGSGYGGAVAAARLAEAGIEVCVLERGKEYLPGDFPSQLGPLIESTQIHTPINKRPIGPRDGLFHVEIGEGMSALVGCALGGTSQINAGVVAAPLDPVFFEKQHWPTAFVEHRKTYFNRVKEMLGAQPHPNAATLPKVKALKQFSKGVGLKDHFPNLDIAVAFKDGLNNAGFEQRKCLECGECVTGCNYGAKNTLTTNYLPFAKARGAELFTGVTVKSLLRPTPENKRWGINYHATTGTNQKVFKVEADIVILAAGTLGTTKLLLFSRRKERSLFSKRLGHSFSGNGDMISFGVGLEQEVRAVGYGDRPVPVDRPVGPCIAGMIDARLDDKKRFGLGFVVQEGVAPYALSRILGEVSVTGAMLKGSFCSDDRDHLAYTRNTQEKTQIYLVTGHDKGDGKIVWSDDRAVLTWPTASQNTDFDAADKLLQKSATILGGQYVQNPFRWSLGGASAQTANTGDGNAFTVHPLGGCRMATTPDEGVVNLKGQVYRGSGDKTVFENLYVMDGSIIPQSLGINPLLSIAALAEYLVHNLICDQPDLPHRELICTNLSIEVPEMPDARLEAASVASPLMNDGVGLQFSETLIGDFNAKPALLHRAKIEGVRGASKFRKIKADFVFKMEDGGKFLDEAKHVAILTKAQMQEIPSGASNSNDDPNNMLLTLLAGPNSQHDRANRVELLEPQPATKLKRWLIKQLLGKGQQRTSLLPAWLRTKIYEFLTKETRYMRYIFLAQDAAIPTWRYRVEGKKTLHADGIVTDILQFIENRIMSPRSTDAAVIGWLHRMRARFMWTRPDNVREIVRQHWRPTSRLRDLWDDLTHIHFEVRFDDESPFKGKLAGKGDARVDVKISDLIMRLIKEPNGIDGLASLLSAYALVGRTLVRTHSALFTTPTYGRGVTEKIKPIELEKIVRNEIPYSFPEVMEPPWFRSKTPFNEQFRLTNFPGGKKGPVLLIHGFGTASTSFAATYMKGKSLLRYLFDLGYDVWLLDYRTSIALKSSRQLQCTLDDIAKEDIPWAMKEVLRLTKTTQLDIVAQCQGAVAFWMALLAKEVEANNIRCFVSSQCGPILVPWYANKVKAPLADFLGQQFGVEFVRPYPKDLEKQTTTDRLIDRFLSAYPLPESEQCTNATCQRITAIYGLLYRHSNIQYRGKQDANSLLSTHQNLHRLFGPANMTFFRHIAKNFANEKIVDHEGRNAYLQGIDDKDNRKVPVLFIHGENNYCFDQDTAVRSSELLTQHGWNSRVEIIPSFGHLDCIIGDDADKHVFPKISGFLARNEGVKP